MLTDVESMGTANKLICECRRCVERKLKLLANLGDKVTSREQFNAHLKFTDCCLNVE